MKTRCAIKQKDKKIVVYGGCDKIKINMEQKFLSIDRSNFNKIDLKDLSNIREIRIYPDII